MGEGGALGGEVGGDEVEHAGGGAVEQRVDGVAVLGDGRFQSLAAPSRARTAIASTDVATSPSAERSGAIQASTSSAPPSRASTRRQPLPPQLGVPGVPVAPRRRTSA